MDQIRFRRFIAVALVVLYAIGLLLLFFGFVQPALVLWIISTAGGILLLYLLKKKEEKTPSAPSDDEEH